MPEGRADHDDRGQALGALGEVDDRLVDGVEEDVLEEQVVDRVAGEGELGEEGHGDPVVVEALDLLEDARRIRRRIGVRDRHRARRDPGEAVPVEVAEVGGLLGLLGHGASLSRTSGRLWVVTRIYHLAEPAEWTDALESGSYERSTRGVSLADEGFIHASSEEQWPVVRRSFYGDVAGPLLLLEIDPDLLASPLVVEVGNPETGEEFPHIYGPLDVDAVVGITELEAPHGA